MCGSGVQQPKEWFSAGGNFAPRGHLQDLETCLIVMTWDGGLVLLAFSGWGPQMLLKIPPCVGQTPRTKDYQAQSLNLSEAEKQDEGMSE